ncbi:sugar phosphate isomerase/epimerase family protein [Parapedobacter tibetensis]|uniref:sugar phosphate isomerase/epimerase family protein n=1 Tax=Parapedobacter tibetensis TaxID=2972951 RepID=UPI00214D4ADB|nr:sugar phosphate isomerase/epimerase family protein [Parapedobacter tibetensis]
MTNNIVQKIRTKKPIIFTWTVGILVCVFLRCHGQAQPFHPELGVCTKTEHIHLLKRCGYGFIQPGVQDYLKPAYPADSLVFVKDFPVYACNVFLPGQLKVVGKDANPDGVMSYADEVFKRAQQAGVRMIVFGSGGSRRIPEGFDREKATDQFVELCIRLAKLAERYDVMICLENLNSGETNFINTVAEAHAIAVRVGHPNFKLLVDIFHMLREAEPPENIVLAGNRYVYHVDIAEMAERTAPGFAGDDFRPYLRALRDISYTGKIALECGFTDMEAELPKAIEALRHQLNTL